jgi:hypothetical protein
VAGKPPRLRTVVREAAFELALRNLVEKARDADEFLENAERALARDPRIGRRVTTSGNPVWFLPMILEERIRRPLILYYTFDTDQVYLIHIQYAILEVQN